MLSKSIPETGCRPGHTRRDPSDVLVGDLSADGEALVCGQRIVIAVNALDVFTVPRELLQVAKLLADG